MAYKPRIAEAFIDPAVPKGREDRSMAYGAFDPYDIEPYDENPGAMPQPPITPQTEASQYYAWCLKCAELGNTPHAWTGQFRATLAEAVQDAEAHFIEYGHPAEYGKVPT